MEMFDPRGPAYEIFGPRVDFVELAVAGAISLFLVMLGLLVLAFIAGLAVRVLVRKKHGPQHSVDETRLIQDIYAGLEELNVRVESLETLMLDNREELKPV